MYIHKHAVYMNYPYLLQVRMYIHAYEMQVKYFNGTYHRAGIC